MLRQNLITFTILGLSLITFCSHARADTLTAVVNHVAATNPKVLAAKQNRLSIDHAITQAQAGYLPHIKATASYGPETSRNSNTVIAVQNGGNTTTVSMPVTQAGLTIDQMVFDGFATKGEVLRQTARANAAAYQVRAAIEDAALSTAQAYLDILKARTLVALAERNVRDHSSIYHMLGIRTKRGLSNEADLTQSQGRLALAQTNLAAEQYNLQDAIARYHLVVGEDPHDLTLPLQISSAYIPHSEQEALEFAGKNNPTVKSAQADIQQAFAQRDVAKAPNYPRLDLQVGVDRNRNEGGVRGPDYDEFIYAKVSYDIYAGGAIIGRQKETEHLASEAEEIMYNAYRQAKEETKLGWSNLQISREVLPYLKTHRNDSGNVINAYNEQYKLDKRTLLDLLDVQDESYAAKHAYIEGEYKILISKIQLFHGMGNLAQALQITLPPETCLYKMC